MIYPRLVRVQQSAWVVRAHTSLHNKLRSRDFLGVEEILRVSLDLGCCAGTAGRDRIFVLVGPPAGDPLRAQI